MKTRVNFRLIAPSILLALALASTASGQWTEDSVDVGGAWVGSLAYNPLMDVVYGGCHVAGIFFVIDCATNSVLTRWNLPRPQSLVYDSIDDKVYCTTGSSDYDTVYVIDGTTFQPVARIPVYWALEAVWDPDRNRVYVSSGEDNEIAVIDCTTDSVIATVHVGRYPIKMSLNRQHGKLYVLNTDGESVSIVDLEALEETEEIRLDNVPECGLYSEAAGKFYCGVSRTVTVIDGAGDSVVAELALPHLATPRAIAENPDLGLILVGTEWINDGYLCTIRTSDDSLTREIACPDGPLAALWSGRSRQFYVTSAYGYAITVVNSDGSAVVAEVPVQDSPFCMALSPRQHRLYVGHLNSRLVYVLRDQSIGVEEHAGEPTMSGQLRVWPSPFRQTLTVACDGGEPCRVFGADGRLIRTLTPTGGLCRWNGRDEAGHDVSPGVYVVERDGRPERRKVVKQ